MPRAIKVEQLSKAYQLGDFGTGTISRDLERYWALLRGKEDPFLKLGEKNDRRTVGKSHVVWSLKDISFSINQGDTVGIIGRNGAGKSTLLKILSRTTAPTKGKVNMKGRVASLLEVGTGFHPELTGRENIFLNGAILGMRKNETQRKFDEIVDFSGVERYIDTPVKRYSSGMYVRLAFAVAAHLESEILIVDEVLAVGDAEFQKKCVGKMSTISKNEGRTLLFVSHNMGSIQALCKNAILLHNGELVEYDKTYNVINKYLQDANNITTVFKPSAEENGYSLAEMAGSDGLPRIAFGFDEELALNLHACIDRYHEDLEIALKLVDVFDKAIFTIHEKVGSRRAEGVYRFRFSIPGKFLTPGNYSWVICINHPGAALYDVRENVMAFKIEETGSDFSRYTNYGVVFPIYKIERY